MQSASSTASNHARKGRTNLYLWNRGIMVKEEAMKSLGRHPLPNNLCWEIESIPVKTNPVSQGRKLFF
jgi:hypothetical protein